MPNAPADLPTLLVGTTPVQVINIPSNGTNPTNGFKHQRWSLSVSLQSDPANTGTIFVGDSTVSALKYSRALQPGDFYVVAGSAVDPSRVWVIASVAAQTVHPSRN